MHNLAIEDPVDPHNAPPLFPPTASGKAIHWTSVVRWIKQGVRPRMEQYCGLNRSVQADAS